MISSPVETRVVAIVGMCGAGKSIVSDHFVAAGYQYVRFGQVVLDEVKRRGISTNTESTEREVREGLRKEHGMAAFAILNIPKIDELLKQGNVIADGLYSWAEYKVLKEKYGSRISIIAVYAPASIRYARLENRAATMPDDPDLRYRSFSPEQAKSRDYSEIENIEKGGPIAMADFTISNTGTIEFLNEQTYAVINQLSSAI